MQPEWTAAQGLGARKRTGLTLRSSLNAGYTAHVGGQSAPLSEPIDQDILAVYDTSESEDEHSHKPKFTPPLLAPYRRAPNFWSSGSIFVALCLFVGVFTFFVHFYSLRQLEKIKEDRGLHDVKSKPHPEMWWTHALIYHIYPRSFQDSNGDGIGDIPGILQRLHHLEYLQVEAVMLGAIFSSAMVDHGKDVTDFYSVDPVYGSMAHFDQLVRELHKRNIKLILEIIPNHTSDKHKWFQHSRRGGAVNNYTDYYVWHPGKIYENGTRTQPSNWLSRYGGSAWSWDGMRGEYYLHQYDRTMPDLNHHSAHLRDHMLHIWEFWLQKGVDGFWMDGVNAIFEMEEFTLDEFPSENPAAKPGEYEYLVHDYTDDQPEVHEFMATWREFLDAYALKTNKRIFLGVDVMDDMINDVIKYYFTGAEAPFCYILTHIHRDCDASCIHHILDLWLEDVPDGRPSLWVLSNMEYGRLVSRKGTQYAQALAMLHLLLPGSAVIYYGEEIGLQHTELGIEEMVDIKGKRLDPDTYKRYSRDAARTPMQWSAERHGGFSTAAQSTWLPVDQHFPQTNVQIMKSTTGANSILQLYQKLAKLRQQPAFRRGRLKYAFANDHLFSFIRFTKEESPFLVAINFGNETVTQDFTFSVGMEYGQVAVFAGEPNPDLVEDKNVNLMKLSLKPGEAVAISLF